MGGLICAMEQQTRSYCYAWYRVVKVREPPMNVRWVVRRKMILATVPVQPPSTLEPELELLFCAQTTKKLLGVSALTCIALTQNVRTHAQAQPFRTGDEGIQAQRRGHS